MQTLMPYCTTVTIDYCTIVRYKLQLVNCIVATAHVVRIYSSVYFSGAGWKLSRYVPCSSRIGTPNFPFSTQQHATCMHHAYAWEPATWLDQMPSYVVTRRSLPFRPEHTNSGHSQTFAGYTGRLPSAEQNEIVTELTTLLHRPSAGVDASGSYGEDTAVSDFPLPYRRAGSCFLFAWSGSTGLRKGLFVQIKYP